MIGLSLVLGGVAAYLVFNDARACGQDSRSAALWALGTLGASLSVLVLVGVLVVYFLFGRHPQRSAQREQIIDIEAELVEEVTACPKCGRKVKQHFKVCPFCSQVLKPRCVECGRDLEPDWRVCPYCEASTGAR